MNKTYPSDLSKKEWKAVKKLLPERGNPHRLKWKWREILNAMFYVLRTGCQWRYLPCDFPPWRTVYHYQRLWSINGLWEQLGNRLREILRQLSGRKAKPSALIMDTQTAKSTEVGGERGFDGHKRINGRKRFSLVDTLGWLMKAKVVAANLAETQVAQMALEHIQSDPRFAEVKRVWADQGFGGEPFCLWLKQTLGWELEITQGISKPGKPDFKVAPRRWVVERSIAWMARNRHMAREYDRCASMTEAWMWAAMVRLMLNRLQNYPSSTISNML
jgi:putative transposase